jgi:hypothetical protein
MCGIDRSKAPAGRMVPESSMRPLTYNPGRFVRVASLAENEALQKTLDGL